SDEIFLYKQVKKLRVIISDNIESSNDRLSKILRDLLDEMNFFLSKRDYKIQILHKNILAQTDLHLSIPGSLNLTIDYGSAPPEVVADILADISLLYQLEGGSGLEFSFDGVYQLEGQNHG
ncbi:MAG: hypothetical protein AAGA66_19465, partial [Bacteroidota bacterium]